MSAATLPPPSQTPSPTTSEPVERIERSKLPPDVPPFELYRFSVEQYHAMIDHGIVDEYDKTELLDGWIASRMTVNPPHCATVHIVRSAIADVLPSGWHPRIQAAITLDDGEPEPDLAVVRGVIRDYLTRHPSPNDVGILMEVSDATLRKNRKTKAVIYARANVPIYWIVNLLDEQVEVYSDPSGSADAPRYQTLATYHRGDHVPLVLDGTEIALIPVDDLLP